MKTILLLQTFSTLFMVGLIWFVQIVHYPLFSEVGQEQFANYERLHQRLTTYVVMPVMFAELGTAIALVTNTNSSRLLVWIGLILLAIAWLSTWALQVPAHNALSAAFSEDQYQKLVRTNWIRTTAWTARGFVVLALLQEQFRMPAASSLLE